MLRSGLLLRREPRLGVDIPEDDARLLLLRGRDEAQVVIPVDS